MTKIEWIVQRYSMVIHNGNLGIFDKKCKESYLANAEDRAFVADNRAEIIAYIVAEEETRKHTHSVTVFGFETATIVYDDRKTFEENFSEEYLAKLAKIYGVTKAQVATETGYFNETTESVTETTESVTEFNNRMEKAKAYDNLHNEGGDGYNPYRKYGDDEISNIIKTT